MAFDIKREPLVKTDPESRKKKREERNRGKVSKHSQQHSSSVYPQKRYRVSSCTVTLPFKRSRIFHSLRGRRVFPDISSSGYCMIDPVRSFYPVTFPRVLFTYIDHDISPLVRGKITWDSQMQSSNLHIVLYISLHVHSFRYKLQHQRNGHSL